MRRLVSILLLSVGVANLVWLNRTLYPRYQASQAPALAAAGFWTDPSPTAKQDRIKWLHTELNAQPPFLDLTFETRSPNTWTLTRYSVAQLQHFAVQLAGRGNDYWVQLRGLCDGSEKERELTEQRAQRVRALLVESGLQAKRILVAESASEAIGPKAAKRVQLRVLEVQTQ